MVLLGKAGSPILLYLVLTQWGMSRGEPTRLVFSEIQSYTMIVRASLEGLKSKPIPCRDFTQCHGRDVMVTLLASMN